jgi:hypothetical protein
METPSPSNKKWVTTSAINPLVEKNQGASARRDRMWTSQIEMA